MSDDFVGGSNSQSKSTDDIAAAKLKAKELEAEREAREGGGAGQSGGVGFGGSVGSIGGSVAGRDLIGGNVTTTTITSGIDANALAQLVAAFKGIETKIDARPPDPNVDKAELKDTVKKVEEEVKKGEEANPTKVERWLKFLGDMAPDILQVTAATLANPVLGLSVAIKKIAEKAQGHATA